MVARPVGVLFHEFLHVGRIEKSFALDFLLGGVWQGGCHQRRARRAEEASFSVLVSNLDFRVPRLRQRGGSGSLTGPCSVGKEAARGVQNQGQGYRGVAG